VRALVESQRGAAESAKNDAARTRLKDAEALRRLQDAIVAGIDPAAVKDAINAGAGTAGGGGRRTGLRGAVGRMDSAEVYAMIALGDVGEAIKDARPDSLTRLFQELGIKVRYRHVERGGLAVISLVVANVRARGGLAYYPSAAFDAVWRQQDQCRMFLGSHPSVELSSFPVGSTLGRAVHRAAGVPDCSRRLVRGASVVSTGCNDGQA
jgi:hypothetical protein